MLGGERGWNSIATDGHTCESANLLLHYHKEDNENLDGIISNLDEENREMAEEQVQKIEDITTKLNAIVKQKKRL